MSASTLSALSGSSRLAISLWLNTTFAADDDIILELSTNSNSNAGTFKIIANESSSGTFWIDVVGDIGKTAASIPSPSNSAWHHILINVEFANSALTEIESWYVDGSAQTMTKVYVNNNNTGTFGNYTLYVMSRANSSLFADGAIADLCIWAPSSAISSGDAATLAGGARANTVRNSEIAYYWPLLGNSSPEPATIGGVDLTVNGATSGSDPAALAASALTPLPWLRF